MTRHMLGEFEKSVLLALIALKEEAYGVSIQRLLSDHLQRDVAIGAVYTTLQRLQDKGLVSSFLGESTPIRGGRAKRYFRIEAPGSAAIAASNERARRLGALRPVLMRGQS